MSILKKEHIKQAIEAIAAANPEAGYTLDEMLGMGRIRLLPTDRNTPEGDDFHLIFDDRLMTIRKILFFNQGTVPIEERLLVKYGEMRMQHQLAQSGGPRNFRAAAQSVRKAGLHFMVTCEIEHALAKLQAALTAKGADAGWVADRSARLRVIKAEQPAFTLAPGNLPPHAAVTTVYQGTVDNARPSYFVNYPFCMDALVQAADVNLEFFNIRFLLTCWVRGLEQNLFACVVDDTIEGMVYLTFKKSIFYKALEIHYIATARGRPATDADSGRRELKGVGAFLTAGVWMLWKNRFSDCKDLLLDSEIGARRFYERVGFQSRGSSGFVMKEPGGRLLPVILKMAAHASDLPERTASEIQRLLKKQIDLLRTPARSEKENQMRQDALESVRVCLQAQISPDITRTVLDYLARHRHTIPEADWLSDLKNTYQQALI